MAKKTEYLYEKVQNYLMSLIEQNQHIPNFKLPSEQQLVQKFSVSRVSVNAAMSILERNGLIKRIQGKGTFAVRNDHTVPPPEPKLPENGFIAMIVPHIAPHHVIEIMNAAAAYFRKLNYPLMILDCDYSQQNEEENIQFAIRAGAVGLIVYPANGEQYNMSIVKLCLNKFPIVLVDRHLEGIDISYISTDHYNDALNLTQYCIDRGHRHIGLFQCAPIQTSSIIDRKNGYIEALIRNDIHVDYSLILMYEGKDSVHSTLQSYFESHPEITSFISISGDVWTSEIVSVLRELRLIDKIELCFFDHEHAEYRPLLNIDYTVVKQDTEKIGTLASEILLDKIINKTVERKHNIVPSQILRFEKIKREG